MYKYSIDDCDVHDKDKLGRFRDIRSKWISWLLGDDPHSIWQQINRLLWDDVLFRTVYDLRRKVSDHPSEEVGFNLPVLRLFDAGFFSTQVTAIRRLTEPQPPDVKNKGIISLRRLVQDIRDNRSLITRELFISYDGLPYDFEQPRKKENDKMLADGTFGRMKFCETTGPNAWETSETVHSNFDKLSKRPTSNTRKRDDLIDPEWFDSLDYRLDICKDIRKYTDKFVAHAAEPDSRIGLTEEQTIVTLEHLTRCQKAIYQVAAFISGQMLWECSHGAIPTPLYDHLENIEKVWIRKAEIKTARQFWKTNREAIEKWESEDLWVEFSSITDSIAS